MYSHKFFTFKGALKSPNENATGQAHVQQTINLQKNSREASRSKLRWAALHGHIPPPHHCGCGSVQKAVSHRQ